MRLAFVCVQNAGRSQMAAAFATRECAERGLDGTVEVVTGGMEPADGVHEEVVRVMRETGIDLSDRVPREITVQELQNADTVITMGCSAADACPATWSGDSRDWDLTDPHGASLDGVRDVRDEIDERVGDLFDEIDATTERPS